LAIVVKRCPDTSRHCRTDPFVRNYSSQVPKTNTFGPASMLVVSSLIL
jgi:hypothetical protein